MKLNYLSPEQNEHKSQRSTLDKPSMFENLTRCPSIFGKILLLQCSRHPKWGHAGLHSKRKLGSCFTAWRDDEHAAREEPAWGC